MHRRPPFVRILALVVAMLGAVAPSATTAVQRSSQTEPKPALPQTLKARVVLGTKYGTAVRVSYCYASLSSDPYRRPRSLRLTVDNLRDDNTPLSLSWPISERCGTIIHPVGGIQQPYILRYYTESHRSTLSETRTIKLAPLPELARRPELPSTFVARLATDANGRAVRVSYCFRSLPRDRSRRPATLWVVIHAEPIDPREEATFGGSTGGPVGVTKRCGQATFSVKGRKPPYTVVYSVVSKNGTRSGRGRVVVR